VKLVLLATPRRNILVASVLAALVAATPIAAQSLSDRQSSLDNRISAVKNRIEYAKRKEGVLSDQIANATAEIKSLGSDITVLSAEVEELESELARFRARLAELVERYEYQTKHLKRLQRDHAAAQRALEDRLVQLYESDEMDAVEILLQVQSLGELIERIDFANEIGRQDKRISNRLKNLKYEMRVARKQTGELRDEVAEATAVVADKTAEAQAARATLVARQAALEAARSDKSGLLSHVREERHDEEEDLDQLLAQSSALAAQIQASQSSGSTFSGGSSSGGDTTPSASGFIWPVSGVVTSGFGPRWGRMHEGIDISAPSGTAVRAAAAGNVIIAGSMGGYGTIIVIDHGNGLSTAYAHLSSIWVGGGTVSQGQGIGAVGCTGSCTGPHLHFEVRVNGTPVNPLSYL
jgi:murein DD-endopeptidase MepM/ murein hydrolase activator NlpD